MKRTLLILGGTFGLAAVASAGPVGIASSLMGKAEMKAPDGTVWKPLRLLQRLEAGDAVRCEAGGEVVIVCLETAERFKVSPGANAVVEPGKVRGADKVGGLRGPAIRIAKGLGGSRTDAFMARPAQSHQRLTPDAVGWILEGERHFQWASIPGAASYSFTLFDAADNVVWSARVTSPSAEYPAELPFFALRRAHVWRLAPFGGSGKPVMGSRWGMITFLSRADADQLTAEAAELAGAEEGTDVTSLVMLAELYRSYGVLERTLETLENPRLSEQPGIREAQDDVYRQVSRYAQILRPGAEAAAEPKSEK
jgi:hypothetical protein